MSGASVRIATLLASAASFLWPAQARADEPPTFADRGEASVDEDDRTLGFLVNPFRTALGAFGVEGDFVFAPRFAAAIDVAAIRRSGATDVALAAGLLFFPLRGAFHGLYAEPRALYVRPFEEPVSRVDWKSDAVAFGAVAGWQWTWDYGLSVRMGAGAQYYVGAEASSSGAPRAAIALGSERLELVVDASLGWVF